MRTRRQLRLLLLLPLPLLSLSIFITTTYVCGLRESLSQLHQNIVSGLLLAESCVIIHIGQGKQQTAMTIGGLYTKYFHEILRASAVVVACRSRISGKRLKSKKKEDKTSRARKSKRQEAKKQKVREEEAFFAHVKRITPLHETSSLKLG